MNQFQRVKMINLINYLLDNNKYYSAYFKDKLKIKKITLNDIDYIYNDIEPISKFDILDNIEHIIDTNLINDFGLKNIISEINNSSNLSYEHDKQIISPNTNRKLKIEVTSGSTGKPFPIIKSQAVKLIEANYLQKCRRSWFRDATVENGFFIVHRTDKVLKDIDYRTNYRSGTLAGGHEIIMSKVFNRMLETQPSWIFTTADFIIKLCNYIIVSGRLNEIKGRLDIKFIETTSAKLQKEERELVHNVFSSVIVDNYGAREVWNIGYECRNHNLHANDSYLLVDCINLNSKHEGDVVLTHLNNKFFPLLKYRIGDKAIKKDIKCGCGNESSVLELIKAKNTDKLFDTQFNAAVIFKKILRNIHMHYDVTDIGNVKIVEKGSVLNVYLEKQKKFDSFFEDKFSLLLNHFTESRLKTNKINFIYDYPFDSKNSYIKENLFKKGN